MNTKEGLPGRPDQTATRILMHCGNKSVPYFQEPPLLEAGQRGAYVFERRVAIGSYLPPHTFDEHVFLLPVGGEGVPFKSALNGHQIRGYIEPWRFRFLAAGDSLSTSWAAPMDSILVTIHPHTLHRALSTDPDSHYPELISRIAAHEDQVLRHLTLAMQSYLASDRLAGKIFENSLLAAIAARLLFNYGNGRRSNASGTLLPRWKRVRVETYIRENFANPLTLADAAAVVEMNPYQLCRTFRATTGQNLWQFVLECRVREAMRRICNRRALPLAHIARDCGFESYSQFIAAFRKFIGCLPSEYRRTIGR